MLWLLPHHLIHTTRQLLHKLKLQVGCFFLVFVWFSASLFFCIKCVSVSLGFSLAGSLTHVESQDGASDDAVDRQSDDVVVTTTPDHHNQTTSAHTEAGGEVFFCEMYGFCCILIVLVKC